MPKKEKPQVPADKQNRKQYNSKRRKVDMKNDIYTITAVENNGKGYSVVLISLKILKEGIDAVEACKAAAREYVATQEGVNVYGLKRESFNWTDFNTFVPNSVCEKYGFIKLDTAQPDRAVNCTVQLVDEPTFHIENIQWDTDGEEMKLPTEYDLPLSWLMDRGERYETVDVEELKDRATNYLSDEFGFCIFGLNVTP